MSIFFGTLSIMLLAIFTSVFMTYIFIWILNIFVDLPIKNKYKKVFYVPNILKKRIYFH